MIHLGTGPLPVWFSSHSLSSLSSWMVVVEWLYSPCAINCSAKPFLKPLAFLILARLFWNHILIWDSLRLSSWASTCRRCSVMYRFTWNSVLSLCSCSAVKAVRGRLSSLLLFDFFSFRVRGPAVGTKRQQSGNVNTQSMLSNQLSKVHYSHKAVCQGSDP